MSTIISFVNQKGGVGKTTSVINIAAALTESEKNKNSKKILIIDMDPQGNSSQIYATITDNDLSIYNLLIQQSQSNNQNKKINIQELTQSTYIKNLDILPSNVLLSSAELDLVNTHARETTLKRILKENSDFLSQYDYILIDCQPSLGILTVDHANAMGQSIVDFDSEDNAAIDYKSLCKELINKTQSSYLITS